MRYGRAGLWLLAALVLMTGCAGGNPSDEKQWVELTYVTNLEDAEQLLTLQEPLRRTLNIVYHKRKYLSESMQRFIALCRETGEQ